MFHNGDDVKNAPEWKKRDNQRVLKRRKGCGETVSFLKVSEKEAGSHSLFAYKRTGIFSAIKNCFLRHTPVLSPKSYGVAFCPAFASVSTVLISFIKYL